MEDQNVKSFYQIEVKDAEEEFGTANLSASVLKQMLKRAEYWNTRAKVLEKTGWMGFVINFLVGLIKFIIGIWSNSLPIRTDGAKGMTESMTSIVSVIGAHYSNKSPDKDHPNGYGRVEYIATIITSLITLVTGWELLKESVERIFHPELSSVSYLQIAIVFLTVFAKWYLAREDKEIGEKYDSHGMLMSSRSDYISIFSTILVIVNALSSKFFHVDIDGYVGTFLALLILWSGIECFKGSVDVILETPASSEMSKGIFGMFRAHKPILNASNLKVSNNGAGHIYGTINVLVPGESPSRVVYHAVRLASEEVFRQYGIILIAGIYVTNAHESKMSAIYQKVDDVVKKVPGVCGIDSFYYDPDQKNLDLNLNLEYEANDNTSITEEIKQAVHTVLPDVHIEIGYFYNKCSV